MAVAVAASAGSTGTGSGCGGGGKCSVHWFPSHQRVAPVLSGYHPAGGFSAMVTAPRSGDRSTPNFHGGHSFRPYAHSAGSVNPRLAPPDPVMHDDPCASQVMRTQPLPVMAGL